MKKQGNRTLFSAHPVTFAAIEQCYGPQAIVTGVKSWYHPVHGWQEFPATSAMAMPVEQQILQLAEVGAITIQLYIDVAPGDTRSADFLTCKLFNQQCSTSSTSPSPSAEENTRPSTTSASSKAPKPPSRPASKNTAQDGAPASPPPATSEESTTK